MNDNLVPSWALPTRESGPVLLSQAPCGPPGAGILISLVPWEAGVGVGSGWVWKVPRPDRWPGTGLGEAPLWSFLPPSAKHSSICHGKAAAPCHQSPRKGKQFQLGPALVPTEAQLQPGPTLPYPTRAKDQGGGGRTPDLSCH